MYLDMLPTMIKKALGLGLFMAMIPMAPAETPAKNKPYKIVYIAGIASDPYYIALNRGAQAEAQKQGATVQFSGSPSAFSPSSVHSACARPAADFDVFASPSSAFTAS